VAGERFKSSGPQGAASDSAAYAEAVRLLARRPRSEQEVRRWLEQRSHSSDDIDAALQRLLARGYVDDAELALHFIVARAQRLGHGPRRLLHELERRGVNRGTAERAWERAVDEGQLDAKELLRAQVRRRIGSSSSGLDERSYRRVYNALLRAGFEAPAIKAALDAFRSVRVVANDDGLDE